MLRTTVSYNILTSFNATYVPKALRNTVRNVMLRYLRNVIDNTGMLCLLVINLLPQRLTLVLN